MYYIILQYIVYSIILQCICCNMKIFYYIVLCILCIILYSPLYYIVCYITLYHILVYYIISYYIVLCHVILCYIVFMHTCLCMYVHMCITKKKSWYVYICIHTHTYRYVCISQTGEHEPRGRDVRPSASRGWQPPGLCPLGASAAPPGPRTAAAAFGWNAAVNMLGQSPSVWPRIVT